MTESRYVCREETCDRGALTGHALYRTSPKGALFEGACSEHFEGEPDPIVEAIERQNLGVNEPYRKPTDAS